MKNQIKVRYRTFQLSSSLLPARPLQRAPSRLRRECRELTGSARGNLRRDLLQLAKDMLAVARLFEL